MNDSNRPANPFGRIDRTIIRPNPGGRLPQAPDARSPSTDPGAAPRAPYSPTPASASPSSTYSPQAAGYAAPPTTPEEWASTPAAPLSPPVAPAAGVPLRVDELVAPNANPIMRSAGPLLQLLGRLRVALMRASFAHLMEQVADAVKFFETDIRSAGISEDQANTAKYVLCATADDIVQHIPTEDRHVWTQYSMLSRFFGERVGGVRFFEILDRLKVDPLVNYPVLELQHACLALGFQGMHRSSPNGVASLQVIQRNLYETLRRVRPKSDADLSPHWRGQQLANRRQRVRIPVWMVAALAATLLMAGYFTLRTLLSARAEDAAAVALALHPADPIELKRRVIAPPPPPPPPPPPERITQLQRIRNALAAEKTACAMTADQTGSFIIIRVCDLILFEPGEATVLDAFKPVAARVAATLDKEPKHIRIVGHTDNSPIRTVRFPSNFELSLARAKAVAAVLRPGLTDPDRIDIEGKGPDSPIAGNTTPEGRAKNRRVEIFIERSE
ncbi:MAG TPA: type VI secretion system protein TssL, long form [Bradyrhizobium sp.]|nr:type VI secretion system protein TssL, long form [Bradyrhizobium sp.]